jgi:protein-disulfide isomerase
MSQDPPTPLTVPVGPEDHSIGPADAPVTLVEYGDYECPYCRQAHPTLKQIRDRFGDEFLFVFRNFPIRTTHPHAQHAAEAAEAAGAQGRYWEMHDILFENQEQLDDASLRAYAARLQLNLEQFNREMSGHTHADRVRNDFMGGVRSGVNGTPTFYLNGFRYELSWELEPLTAAIEEATRQNT